MKKPVLLAEIFLLMLGSAVHCSGSGPTKEAVRTAFLAIGSTPAAVSYRNDKAVNNSGGHLQGIQLAERTTGSYAVMTGSSDSHSYLSVVRLGGKEAVVTVNKLMDKPFKHAGGCQLYGNYLAVGIEDNAKKDRSKVCIFDLTHPEQPNTEPLAVILRSGEPLRSTAGCTGLTQYRDKWLLAVGDWDTKHIDFYVSPTPMTAGSFRKTGSVDTGNTDRKNWSDPTWWSYQNINLFTIQGTDIYLVGLGQNNNNEDIADLYCLVEVSADTFTLEKIASKTFRCSREVSFRAGAGVSLDSSGSFRIIACGYNIGNNSFLNLFAAPGQQHFPTDGRP